MQAKVKISFADYIKFKHQLLQQTLSMPYPNLQANCKILLADYTKLTLSITYAELQAKCQFPPDEYAKFYKYNSIRF